MTLPEFLADLARGASASACTPRRIRPTSAGRPAPMWELADLKRYASMSIQYSRGCPFDCEFCNITAMFGHRPRTKTPAQVIAELDGLYGLGWRGAVFFVDDNFIGNKTHAQGGAAAGADRVAQGQDAALRSSPRRPSTWPMTRS